VFLFEEHDTSQLCFAAMPPPSRHDDAVVGDCQAWLKHDRGTLQQSEARTGTQLRSQVPTLLEVP
jgi:hypothetical protein